MFIDRDDPILAEGEDSETDSEEPIDDGEKYFVKTKLNETLLLMLIYICLTQKKT